jgi:hypothetical protein
MGWVLTVPIVAIIAYGVMVRCLHPSPSLPASTEALRLQAFIIRSPSI